MTRKSDEERREKQRRRQQAYRARLRQEKKPSHENLAFTIILQPFDPSPAAASPSGRVKGRR